MGTYSKPGLTAGEAVLMNDPAAALSKAIGGVGLAFNTQMANIQISKNALDKSTAELNRQANSIKTDQNNTLAKKTQDAIKKEIDRVYRLKYNSIGRDQSEAIKAESDLLSMVKKMPEVMAFYDEEASLYKKNIINGKANSTISNLNTNENSRGFYDNIANSNGNGITPTYKDGQLIFKYGEGKNSFEQNSVNYYEGVKNGANSNVGYIDQDKYPTAYKAAFTQYSAEFPALKIVQESKNKAGGITNTTKQDYNQQVDLIKNKLMNDKQLLNNIDSDEFQFLIGSSYLTAKDDEVFTGSKDQIERAQVAKVNFIMDQYAKVDQGEMVNGKFEIGNAQTITTGVDDNLPKNDNNNNNTPSNDEIKNTPSGKGATAIVDEVSKIAMDPSQKNLNLLKNQVYQNKLISKVTYDPKTSKIKLFNITKAETTQNKTDGTKGGSQTTQQVQTVQIGEDIDLNSDAALSDFSQALFRGKNYGISKNSNTNMANMPDDVKELLSDFRKKQEEQENKLVNYEDGKKLHDTTFTEINDKYKDKISERSRITKEFIKTKEHLEYRDIQKKFPPQEGVVSNEVRAAYFDYYTAMRKFFKLDGDVEDTKTPSAPAGVDTTGFDPKVFNTNNKIKGLTPEEIKIVDSFSIENTGENKANILKDGEPIVSNKNGVTVTGLRAEGNNVIVDAKMFGIKGTGDLGSFKIEDNKVIFNEGSDYEKLKGADKIDFDTFKKAMELDIAYATEIQKQIKG